MRSNIVNYLFLTMQQLKANLLRRDKLPKINENRDRSFVLPNGRLGPLWDGGSREEQLKYRAKK